MAVEDNQAMSDIKTSQQGRILGGIALALIIILGAWLRFYQLGEFSIGNSYYAAAVKSMLGSWKNFFFVAFEPGGSITVDKPPLGFWLQAVSAYFLGLSGFSLALPQALAGTLSIPLIYGIIQRRFGTGAGLISALVLAVMPIAVATERNNTIDGLLVFTLLLAAWAFIRAAETGKLLPLLLGSVLVGLGFNIKMLQALMPLPAFYLIYLLGARIPWLKRVLYLGIATGVLLSVSLAWVAVVDLTPADQRPYVGSSQNNTVLELIVGHNGLSRLGLSGRQRNDGPGSGPPGDGVQTGLVPSPGGKQPENPPPEAVRACINSGINDPCRVQLRNGEAVTGTCREFNQDHLVCAPDGAAPQAPTQAGRPDGSGPAQAGGRQNETGNPGLVRLFEEPLVTEASWLLPLVLLGVPAAATTLAWKGPSRRRRLQLILWLGWLLPMMAYFSFTSGLFHRYYLIMVGPAIAALAGITAWALARHYQTRPWRGWFLVVFISGLSLIFGLATFLTGLDGALWLLAVSLVLWLGGIGLLLPVWKNSQKPVSVLSGIGTILVLMALLLPSAAWSVLTAVNTNPDVGLPTAGPGVGAEARKATTRQGELDASGERILEYLLARTDPDGYLLAVNNAREAAPFILATGRPVFTFGGFIGSDPVIDLDGFLNKLETGELQYVLGLPQKAEITDWIVGNCSLVDVPGTGTPPIQLFDCGGQP